MPPDIDAFVDRWVEGWNAHDLESMLSHFADDVVFTSPVAARVVAGSEGIIHGKAALRAYWAIGLERIPDLHFEVVDAYVGVDTVVINYRNQVGGLVNEILTFGSDGLVTDGRGTYVQTGESLAGVRDN